MDITGIMCMVIMTTLCMVQPVDVAERCIDEIVFMASRVFARLA